MKNKKVILYISFIVILLLASGSSALIDLTGTYDLVGTGGDGGNPFNQNLNTTNDVVFNTVTSTFFGDGGNLTNLSFGITHTANAITTEAGTLTAGDLTSITYPEDGDSYNVTEDGGVPPVLRININFTTIIDLDSIIGRIWYDGGQGHTMQLEIWRVDTKVWENYAEFTDMTDFVNFYVPIFDPVYHINTTTSDVRVRFEHTDNGIPSHKFHIDYIALIDGITALTTSDHDSLSGRNVKTNHPWALPIDGSRNMTNSLIINGNLYAYSLFGDGGNLTNISGADGNPFNQDLNTTDDVIFNNIVATGYTWVNGVLFVGRTETLRLYYEYPVGCFLTAMTESADAYALMNYMALMHKWDTAIGIAYSDDSMYLVPFELDTSLFSFLGVGVEEPETRIMLPNTEDAGGTGTAYDWAVYSDSRVKSWINELPKDKVISFCENVSIMMYNPINSWFNEFGILQFGDVNVNKINVGISAQDLYNYVNVTFGEKYANAVVHKPQNESTGFWSVSYRNVQMIFDRMTQINHNRITNIENFLLLYGYDPNEVYGD